MSSGDIEHLAADDDDLHVGYSTRDLWWWAIGRKEGSYGGAQHRDEAVKIALDASATAHAGRRRVVVHTRSGDVHHIVESTNQRPSSQFFQDDVP